MIEGSLSDERLADEIAFEAELDRSELIESDIEQVVIDQNDTLDQEESDDF